MSVGIDVRGVPEVRKALAQFGENKPLLQKAASAGAKAIKPFVQAAAPRGATGKLRRSVSARKAKRNLPAAVVSPRAFYRHFVIDGTKAHGPRKATRLVFTGPSGPVFARHVRGTPSRPFVDEGYARGEGAGMAAIDKVIEQALGALK